MDPVLMRQWSSSAPSQPHPTWKEGKKGVETWQGKETVNGHVFYKVSVSSAASEVLQVTNTATLATVSTIDTGLCERK